MKQHCRLPRCFGFGAALLAWALAACSEAPGDNPFDPSLPAERQAPGELLLELELEDAQLLRRFPPAAPLQGPLLRGLLSRDGRIVRALELHLDDVAGDRTTLRFTNLAPGSYGLSLEDVPGLFDVPVLPALSIGIGARRIEQVTLRRQRASGVVVVQREGERSGPVCLGLLPAPAIAGDCESHFAEVLAAFARLEQGRADLCRRSPATADIGGAPEVGGKAEDAAALPPDLVQRYFSFRRLDGDGSTDFRDIPRAHPQYCLVALAAGHTTQVRTLFRTTGNDQLVVTLPRFTGTLALHTFDEAEASCTGEGPCSFVPPRLDAAGRQVTRHRLLFLDPRPAAGEETYDPLVGLEVEEVSSAAGDASSPNAGAPASPAIRFCIGEGQPPECQPAAGQDIAGAPRLLTSELLDVADPQALAGFCPPWLPGGAGEVGAGPDRGEAPRWSEEQVRTLQRAASLQGGGLLAYCLGSPDDGPRRLHVRFFRRSGASSETVRAAPPLLLDREPVQDPRVRLAGARLLDGVWYVGPPGPEVRPGGAAHHGLALLVQGTDRFAERRDWRLTLELDPAPGQQPEPARCRTEPAVDLQLSSNDPGEAVRFDIFQGLAGESVKACQGDYLVKLRVEDAAGNATEVAERLTYDETPPRIYNILLDAGEELYHCPPLAPGPNVSVHPDCLPEAYIGHTHARHFIRPNQPLRFHFAADLEPERKTGPFQYALFTEESERSEDAFRPFGNGEGLVWPVARPWHGGRVVHYEVRDRAGNVMADDFTLWMDSEPPPLGTASFLDVSEASVLCAARAADGGGGEGGAAAEPAAEGEDAGLPDAADAGAGTPAGGGAALECHPVPNAQRILGKVYASAAQEALTVVVEGQASELQDADDYVCARLVTRDDRGSAELVSVQPVRGGRFVTYLPPLPEDGSRVEYAVDLELVDQACNVSRLAAPLALAFDRQPPRAAQLDVAVTAAPPGPPAGHRAGDRYVASPLPGTGFAYRLALLVDNEAEETLPGLELFGWITQGEPADSQACSLPGFGERWAGDLPLCLEDNRGRPCASAGYGQVDVYTSVLALDEISPFPACPPEENRPGSPCCDQVLSLVVRDLVGNCSVLPVSQVDGRPVAAFLLDAAPPVPPSPPQVGTGLQGVRTLTWSGGEDCFPDRIELFAWGSSAVECGWDPCAGAAPPAQLWRLALPCQLPAPGGGADAGACPGELAPVPGDRACYAVRAVDQAGNSSCSPVTAADPG